VHIGLAAKASVLTYTLAKSQACSDGNKRVAVLLLAEFLALNGADLVTTNAELVDMILETASADAADRDRTILTLTTWFEHELKPWSEETLP
jgi:prophage maintenance system killer protein